MRVSAYIFGVIILFLLSGCSKDDGDGSGNGNNEVSYYGLDCGNGPYNCTKNTNQYSTKTANANITNGVLTIEIDGRLTISVTYDGLGAYSTLDTDLMYEFCVNTGGQTYVCYRTNNPPQTGGYMEILSNDGNYIEGNFRFIGHTSASANVTNRTYNGTDNGLYRIKLD